MPLRTKEAQAKYQRDWMQKRRRTWLKANGPCALCGSWRQLQVDHVDPARKVSHRVWSWAERRRNAELAKCQVLCKSCHKKKSAAFRKAQVKHGSWVMRYRYGCTCEPCKRYVRELRYASRRRTGK